MVNNNLVKTLSVVFVFIVAVSSLGVVVADHFMNIATDPRVVSLLTSILGFALSQTGFTQGASVALSATNAVNNPTNSQVVNAVQANTQATNANTQAITASPVPPITPDAAQIGPDVAPES